MKIKLFLEKIPHIFFTKCGINFGTMHTETEGYEGNPVLIHTSLELSLEDLAVDRTPLLYLHRINPKACKDTSYSSTYIT